MISGRAVATLAFVAALAACKSQDADDGAKKEIQIGFTPPTPNAAPRASSTSTADTPSPVFTSFFHDVDAAPAPAPVASAPAAKQTARAVDPDDAAMDAVRARANSCFSQANLAKGQTRAVTLTFHVLATGRVSSTDISGASSQDGAFYSCLHAITDSATFPEKADAGTDVRTLNVTAQATAS